MDVANQEWVPISWFCVNCGTKVTGIKDKQGVVKCECSKCKTYMVRTYKGRRHREIKVILPKEEVKTAS